MELCERNHLFQDGCSKTFPQAAGTGVPGGAEAAADLVRGRVCRAEMGTQPDTSPAARPRDSGKPLPPFCHGPELQKNVKILSVTPMGVFFLA